MTTSTNHSLVKTMPSNGALLFCIMPTEQWQDLKTCLEAWLHPIVWERGNGKWGSGEEFLLSLNVSPAAQHFYDIVNANIPETRRNLPRILGFMLDYFDERGEPATSVEQLMEYGYEPTVS